MIDTNNSPSRRDTMNGCWDIEGKGELIGLDSSLKTGEGTLLVERLLCNLSWSDMFSWTFLYLDSGVSYSSSEHFTGNITARENTKYFQIQMHTIHSLND